jgi:diguanylate cyclase (GGDEF)-like protein/PAS domain S-box-containing protein
VRTAILQQERRSFSMWLCAFGAVLSLVLALLSALTQRANLPGPLPLGSMALAFAGIGELGRRKVLYAEYILPWFAAAAIAMVGVEPGVSFVVNVSIFLPPLSAIVLGRYYTIAGTAVLELVILASRGVNAPALSPYLEPSFLLLFASSLVLAIYAQHLLVRALNQAVHTKAVAGAVSVASDDLVVLRDILEDGTLGAISFVSESIPRVLGHSRESILRSNFGIEFIHPEEQARVKTVTSEVVRGALKIGEWEARVRDAQGTFRWYHGRTLDLRTDKNVRGVVSVLRNIDHERAVRTTYETELKHQAETDALTALPNRRKLARVLAQKTSSLGVLVCDLDGFKHVNDSLGHDVGDQFLNATAARLLGACAGREVELFRLGGDEFVFVMRNATSEKLENLAEALIADASAPLRIELQAPTVLTLSIGIAWVMSEQEQASLLRDADLAMYSAKEAGKNRYRIFDALMQQTVARRHQVEQGLRAALAERELRLVYQPRVNLKTRKSLGVEALLRWDSRTLGSVGPAEFIPVAEETGLIGALGEHVIDEALREFSSWKTTGIVLSINLSPLQIADGKRLLACVENALKVHDVNPREVEFEVTEGVFVKRPEETIQTLTKLKALGCLLSVDDFGTGYSSLAYIRRFPIDTLKIDRSFITKIDASTESRAIVAAVIALARELHIRTVAEGVETAQEFLLLAAMGCDEAQGFYLASPLEPELARVFVHQQESTATVS